jgi:transcriptional regulator with XRE-family HTH domain
MKLRLKEMRSNAGMTLDDLASLVGMSRSYVSEIENGRKQINGRRLEQFAKAFGVRPQDLLDDGGLPADILDHLNVLLKLAPENRVAVVRHAIALLRQQEAQ